MGASTAEHTSAQWVIGAKKNKALTPIASLLVAVAILHMGNGLQGTLLPIRADFETFSTSQIACLGSAYFLGFLLGAFYGPRVVSSVGHIRTFAAMVAIASAVVLCHALLINPLLWFLMRAISGFCFAILYMVIESWLNEKSTNANRGFVFALYAVANFGMVGLGQLLLILDTPQEVALFLISSIIISIAAVPVALTRADPPQPIQTANVQISELYRISPIGLLGTFASGFASGAFWSLAPVFGQTTTGNTNTVAVFMCLSILAGAVGQWPLGLVSDRVDRRYVIGLTSLAAGATSLALALYRPLSPESLFWLSAVFGFFAFPLYTICVAHANDFVAGEKFVEVASGLLLVWAVGAIIGPMIGSSMTVLFGSGGLFLTTALCYAALSAYTAFRLTQRSAAPIEDRGIFIDAVRAGQTVSAIDAMESAK